MKILISNDDGINAEGIRILIESLRKYGQLYVVAPSEERSATGHGITLRRKMKKLPVNIEGVIAYSLDGNPADCVKYAIYGLKEDFDLVVSGINNGPNLGTDIFYSGTVAAGYEGIINDVPSIALSTDFGHFDILENEIECVLDYIISNKYYNKDVLLNINFPEKKYKKSKGIRFTEQGIRIFKNSFLEEDNLLTNTGSYLDLENSIESDVHAFSNGYISITPLQLNKTNYVYLENVKKNIDK